MIYLKNDDTFHRTGLEKRMVNILIPLSDRYKFDLVEQYPGGSSWLIDYGLLFDVDGKQKIAIEVDGPHHLLNGRKKKDNFKDYKLRRDGWKILRFVEGFTAPDVEQRIQSVLNAFQPC